MVTEIEKLNDENKALNKAINSLKNQNVSLSMKNKNQEHIIKKYEEKMDEMINEAMTKALSKVKIEYEKIINDLNNKILKLEDKLNVNSSNSSLPESRNPIPIKISNTRIKSGKTIGGQIGHKQHKLDYFEEEEIDETIEHTLPSCPECNGKIEYKNTIISDIIDFDIKTIRTRNNIYQYHCATCNKDITSNNILPRGVSYGSNVNASAIVLMNDANTPINKVRKYIEGITSSVIVMSEGYISKLQARTANKLDDFVNDLRLQILKEKIVHWDDTVIVIGIKDGYLRFYGNEKWSLIKAHESKNEAGIINDGILPNLGNETTVMHDHVLYNYNEKLNFKNAECNSHILRYLQGVTDNIHDHTWESKLKELLLEANNNREGKTHYEQSYIDDIYKRYNDILKIGYEENKSLVDYHFYKDKELNLISRLDKYQDAHLLFIKDFNVPFSNNTAERSFRISKTKIKVSGLFQNITTASNYANILTYMETCYRNGINKHLAIKRLLDGNPYTISDLLNLKLEQ